LLVDLWALFWANFFLTLTSILRAHIVTLLTYIICWPNFSPMYQLTSNPLLTLNIFSRQNFYLVAKLIFLFAWSFISLQNLYLFLAKLFICQNLYFFLVKFSFHEKTCIYFWLNFYFLAKLVSFVGETFFLAKAIYLLS